MSLFTPRALTEIHKIRVSMQADTAVLQPMDKRIILYYKSYLRSTFCKTIATIDNIYFLMDPGNCTLNRLKYSVNITFICTGKPKKFI